MDVRELLPIGLSLIVLGIALAYGMQVTGDVGDDMTASTYEKNATVETIAALAKIPAKLGLIVTVVIAVVIIGLITRYMANMG